MLGERYFGTVQDEGYGGEIDVEMISWEGKVVRIGVLLKDSEVILEVR